MLVVKSEKNWIVPIEKFNTIYSTSQTQFASLYPELFEVNQSALIQRPINEDDYRDYIKLYSQIRGRGSFVLFIFSVFDWQRGYRICAYAVMSNHTHVVLCVDKDMAGG
ncbi:MAG: hypothetical protein ACJAV1_001506 [Paraglaciecola sp.]|jgi:hypothetical protein